MVLPVHDINPVRRTPWVTYGLVAANVVVLLLTPGSKTSLTGSATTAQLCSQEAFYDHYAAIPRELITDRQLPLVATGQPGPRPDTCYVSRSPYHKSPPLSVLFSMFIHEGWLHLLGNMLFLVIFGNNIEDKFRKVPYLIFYLFCGYVAAYGFAMANQTSVEPLVGASGAIAGVLGAYLVIYPRAKVWSLLPFLFFIPVRIPAWLVLGSWFVLQWVYSAGYAASGAGSVAYLAHVFGFLAGVVVGLIVRAASPPPQYPVHPRYRQSPALSRGPTAQQRGGRLPGQRAGTVRQLHDDRVLVHGRPHQAVVQRHLHAGVGLVDHELGRTAADPVTRARGLGYPRRDELGVAFAAAFRLAVGQVALAMMLRGRPVRVRVGLRTRTLADLEPTGGSQFARGVCDDVGAVPVGQHHHVGRPPRRGVRHLQQVRQRPEPYRAREGAGREPPGQHGLAVRRDHHLGIACRNSPRAALQRLGRGRISAELTGFADGVGPGHIPCIGPADRRIRYRDRGRHHQVSRA